ncbi:hypothetical protein QYF36_005052 [Acer negundo]|nr:hypothetical protein QYF36_005052 [Acer negundo]
MEIAGGVAKLLGLLRLGNTNAFVFSGLDYFPALEGVMMGTTQNQSQHSNSVFGMDYGAINSVGMDRFPPTKMAIGGNSSTFIRHSNSSGIRVLGLLGGGDGVFGFYLGRR